MTLALDPVVHPGAALPAFRLPEPLTGRLLGPEDFPQARAVLVVFLANRCPEVRRLAGALAELAQELDELGLQVLAINSNADDNDPDEAPAAVAAEALRRGYVFPYLIDQTQGVARAFAVERTPAFYLFGPERRLVYAGWFHELGLAVERVLQGLPAPVPQGAANGTALRWRESL